MRQTITVHVPVRFAARGGRKAVLFGMERSKASPRVENAIVKALARAHRWRRQIEDGEYSSITELAKMLRINESYACRLLRLTLLAPQIVTGILNGTSDKSLSISELTKPLPNEWHNQLARGWAGNESTKDP